MGAVLNFNITSLIISFYSSLSALLSDLLRAIANYAVLQAQQLHQNIQTLFMCQSGLSFHQLMYVTIYVYLCRRYLSGMVALY